MHPQMHEPTGDQGEITVGLLEPGQASQWDAYVADSPGASFFHLSGWSRVIKRAFGHRPYYLAARQHGKLAGILPLFHLRSLFFGNSLISVPFCVYGGVIADTSDVQEHLVQHALGLARQLGVDCVELRHRRPTCSGWPSKDLYVTFRKEISSDHEANLMAIPRKQRAMVRKGQKAGLQAVVVSQLDEFYSMYSESVRNLGTPVFSRRYFDLLQAEFGDSIETLVVYDGDSPVATVMSFLFRNEVLPYYGGGNARARSSSANDFMYWAVMERAADKGITVFDYGRSKRGTGSYRFKKHWGFEPQPLAYEFGLVNTDRLPDVSPANPKYRLFIAAWKRLPLSVSRLVGPYISRGLG